jgi:hypothetical protein
MKKMSYLGYYIRRIEIKMDLREIGSKDRRGMEMVQ